MKQILYIGNHLSRSGGNPSVAEVMAPLLYPEIELYLVSDRRQKVWRLLDMLWAVMRFGQKAQPVVLDVYSTLSFYYALIVAATCQIRRIPYIAVLHGGNLPNRLAQNPALCRFLFGKARRLVAPSAYLQHAFAKAGYAVRCIPNFIFLEQYPFLHRAAARPRLLWVRAFDAIYNPALAIHTVHQLAQKYPDVQLCMVGPDKDGSLAQCRALAQQLGVADRVTFTGRLSKAAWIARSTDYDLFLNTTHFDNVPVSVLEAMALGLPVISTDVGGLPYLITSEDEGVLVDEKEGVAGFVSAIDRCLEQPERVAQISWHAREKVARFEWKAVKPMWVACLEA